MIQDHSCKGRRGLEPSSRRFVLCPVFLIILSHFFFVRCLGRHLGAISFPNIELSLSEPKLLVFPRVSMAASLQSPERNWQPGECIPTNSLSVDVHSLLTEIQSSLSSELAKPQGTLSSVVDCLSHLEESVALNSAKLSSQPSYSTAFSTPSTSSCESSGGCPSSRKRKRRLPTKLY